MRLKSITVHGFKSFADRVTINYDKGITGIIGPNGSGKSNVIDAVRWVMGEQTAKSLRADDPTDIIFAGSQSRKPMGMAEVTLTFENDGRQCPPEYLHLPECSITRRIYRDGEREYMLNKEACRLKDISQFLLSIGLGSRTYSIIQQERRDRIVQASPADLRAILEESAGITVFKMQRKEAEKRLHTAHEQLEKLAAVETEMASQSEHLAEQVEKTRRKIALSGELRDQEIALLADNIAFHKSIALAVKAELGKRQQVTQQRTVDTAGFEAEATRLTAEKLELSGEQDDKRRALDDKRLALTKLTERRENQVTLASERANQLASLHETLKSERAELESIAHRLADAVTRMDDSEKQTQLLDGELEALQEQEDDAVERARTSQSKAEALRSEIRVIQSRIESAHSQSASLHELCSVLTRRLDEKLSAQKARAGEVQNLKEALDQLAAATKQDQDLLTLAETRLAEVTAQKAVAADERRELSERHEVKHRQLVEIDARLRSLQDLMDDDAQADADPSQDPVKDLPNLFDLLGLDPEWEDRLETALPETATTRVVLDAAQIVSLSNDKRALQGSRRHVFAPSLFHPLSNEESLAAQWLVKQSQKGAPGEKAALRQASLLLRKGTEHPAAAVFQRLFFCDHLPALLELLASPEGKSHAGGSRSFVFVLPGGALYQGHGELRFGKSQDVRSAGVLRRKREREQLLGNRDEVFAEVRRLESQLLDHDARVEGLAAEADQLTRELGSQREAAIHRQSEQVQLGIRLSHAQEFIASAQVECQALTDDLADQRQRLAAFAEQHEADASKVRSLQESLDNLLEDCGDDSERAAELKRLMTSKREARAAAAAGLAAAKVTFEELTLQKDRTQFKIQRLEGDLKNLQEQLDLTGRSSTDLDAELEILALAVRQGEAELEDLASRLSLLQERIHVLESKISAEKDAQLHTERLIAEKQMELARAEAILETQFRDAWERFGLSETDFTQTEAGPADRREQMESQVRQLKKQLESLGPINEAAVTEYEETEQKLSFLRAQKDDVTASIDLLQVSIQEVEERTKVSFLETYQQVGGRFESLFPILFPGGEARLNLVDPENLLETGVEILVRLPGKRMQNMSLFSGGEKALTAISLIFALLQTSPAPFCYLDEVDAPLDEANVGRFNSVLEALSSDFQFVVITHNRRTMEVLDSIYGISMNEPGVSRLVSVDLSEVPNRMRKEHARKAGAEARPQEAQGEL
jgi:chromosome segregation protein